MHTTFTQTLIAIPYGRLSRDRNKLSVNVSIQLAEACDHIEDRGWQLGPSFKDDDISASRFNTKGARPGYDDLIDYLKRQPLSEAYVIVVTEMSRLYRRVDELLPVIYLARDHLIPLRMIVSTDGDVYDLSTPEGIHQAIGAVNNAMLEPEKTSKRARRKIAANARLGLPHGGRRAFGYEPGNMVICEPEAAVLRAMAERVIAGHSYKETAYWANEAGHRTSEGKLWYPITVRNTLRRPRYAGIRVHHDQQYPAAWPAIFDEPTWTSLQLTVRLRLEQYPARPRARRYLLTGLAYCGKCGTSLNGETRRDKPSRPLRRVYYCSVQGDTQRRRGCGGVTRNADALEDFITEAVLYRLETDSLAELLNEEPDSDAELMQLLDLRRARKQRVDEIVDDYATGALSREQMSRAKAIAEAALEQTEHDIEALNSKRSAHGLLPVGEFARRTWEENDSDNWRREILALLIDRITVNPGITKPFYKGWRFDPTLIEV